MRPTKEDDDDLCMYVELELEGAGQTRMVLSYVWK